MKKKIASLLTAIAVLASGAASIGCVFIVFDEPKAYDSLID